MGKPECDSAYCMEPRNKFFESVRSIVEYEVRPGNMISFLHEVNLSKIEEIRKSLGSQKPSYTAFVGKALALALCEFPYANRRVWVSPWWLPFVHPRYQRFNQVDIAFAAERHLEGTHVAVVADILRSVETLSLAQINEWLHRLALSDETTNAQWRIFCRIVRTLPHWLASFVIRCPVFIPSLWVKYRGGAATITSPAKYGVDEIIPDCAVEPAQSRCIVRCNGSKSESRKIHNPK